MWERKYIIWSNENLDTEDWKESFKEYIEMNNLDIDPNDEEELYKYMVETNDEYLSDERINLNINVPDTDTVLVIADLGLWNGRRSAYREIHADKISDCLYTDRDAKQKEKMFERVNNGEIRVIMGSTSKMGAGTNIQKKLYALFHLDCPWRPSDLEQQEGRIERQGNGNDTVKIFTCITEGTFDGYMYQLIEAKQRVAAQIMTSKSPAREVEEDDVMTLNYAELKALTMENPLFKEKMDLEIAISRLKMQVTAITHFVSVTTQNSILMSLWFTVTTETKTKSSSHGSVPMTPTTTPLSTTRIFTRMRRTSRKPLATVKKNRRCSITSSLKRRMRPMATM